MIKQRGGSALIFVIMCNPRMSRWRQRDASKSVFQIGSHANSAVDFGRRC